MSSRQAWQGIEVVQGSLDAFRFDLRAIMLYYFFTRALRLSFRNVGFSCL